MNNFIAFFRWLFDKPITIKTYITPQFARGGTIGDNGGSTTGGTICTTKKTGVNPNDKKVATLVSAEDVTKSRIEYISGIPYDDIVLIFKDEETMYSPKSKSLERILFDLKYGYKAISL